MPRIDPREKVGALAARFPQSVRVFTRRDIDFCCGGERTLEQACKERNLDPMAVVHEIEASQQKTGAPAPWTQAPLDGLIDYILQRFHHSLVEELCQMEVLSAKAYEAHRERDGERLLSLLHTVGNLKSDIIAHLQKEEQVLFPWIRAGNGHTAADPIRVMHLEHEEAASELRRIRELTNDFTPPGYACATIDVLYASLEKLDADLREHIHLENNILFPRALREQAG